MRVPVLRFKDDDGQDFPEWEETTLGDVCKPQQWKTIAGSELTEFGYPTYGANGQIGFYSDYNHEDETVAVTCRGATCGEVSLIPPKSYITGNAMSLDEINPLDNNHRYVYYALILRGFRDVISGSAQPQIVGSAIKKVEFAKPSIKEQTKIANFLTAVDEKITQLTQKKDLLTQYKKGVMQQIFSQEMRFKDDDGQNFPEWEDGSLGDAFEYRNGKSFENEVSENGEYFLVTLNSIDISGKLKSDHKRVAKTDSSLIANDLVMILSDVAHGNFLGLTDIIPSDKYVLNQRIGGLRAKMNLDVRFASLYINYNQKYFKLHGQGSSQLNLSKGDVLDFNLPIPHINEQTKIANFLTAIDDKITATQIQLKAVKQYKQGLLQQMFV